MTSGEHQYCIHLALEDGATSTDTFRAHLHAVLIQRQLEQTTKATSTQSELQDIVTSAHEQLNGAFDGAASSSSASLAETFVANVAHSEWHCENLLVEEKSMRYKWL